MAQTVMRMMRISIPAVCSGDVSLYVHLRFRIAGRQFRGLCLRTAVH